jgi:hypothetical protein
MSTGREYKRIYSWSDKKWMEFEYCNGEHQSTKILGWNGVEKLCESRPLLRHESWSSYDGKEYAIRDQVSGKWVFVSADTQAARCGCGKHDLDLSQGDAYAQHNRWAISQGIE